MNALLITDRNKQVKAQSEEKMSPEEKKLKLRIKSLFEKCGFIHIDTRFYNVTIGRKTTEFDAIYVKDCLIVVVEESTSGKERDISNHIRAKYEAFLEINKNREVLYKWLRKNFSDCYKFEDFYDKDYELRYVHISSVDHSIRPEWEDLYPEFKFLNNKNIEYLEYISKIIERSAVYELYRFLSVSKNNTTYSGGDKQLRFEPVLVSQQRWIPNTNSFRLVSFMVSAETLISNSFVLRKENWENIGIQYQRMIDGDKIKSARRYLIDNQSTFINNIIVSLPQNTHFLVKSDHRSDQYQTERTVEYDEVGADENRNYVLVVPDEYNSICLIDGQHRVFAHYEGFSDSDDERRISKLRKRVHILVTALVFDPNMSENDRRAIESEVFLSINSNSKPVAADLLLHLNQILKPTSSLGIARSVLAELNEGRIFNHVFKLSSLDKRKIPIASIVKFALVYLVQIPKANTKDEYKYNLFYHWNGEKDALRDGDFNVRAEYVKYCSIHIEYFFEAVKKKFNHEWAIAKDEFDKTKRSDSLSSNRLLSVVSINAFLLTFMKLISEEGVEHIDHHQYSRYVTEVNNGVSSSIYSEPISDSELKRAYREYMIYKYFTLIDKVDMSFKKDEFKYGSSNYKQLSKDILEMMGIL